MKGASSSRKMQPTPRHPAWRVEPETELSLLQSGTPWDKRNLYNCTCDPETRGGKPCLEGLSDAQNAISSKRAALWVWWHRYSRIQVRLWSHKCGSCPFTGPKSSQYEDEQADSAWGDTTTGKSQESSSRTSVPFPSGVGKMMSPSPDLPPTSMRFPTAPKFTSLLETVPMLFPECPEAHATGLIHHQWANLFSSISEQNMLNLASGT